VEQRERCIRAGEGGTRDRAVISVLARAGNLLQTQAGLLALAILLGLCNAVALLGWRVINPSDISWLAGDNASHHLGWAFYRHESSWTFPLTWTRRIGYPEGASIALLDSIPLIPILLRPFEFLLPEPFQYLGLYACVCFVLQAYFGFRLCTRLFDGHTGFVIVGGAFFLLAPPLTWQLYGHYPHLGHWLVLAGLDSYFSDTSTVSPLRWMSRHWLVLVAAVGNNSYIAAMCVLIAFAGLARLRLESRSGWVTTAGMFGATFVVLVASLLTFGLLVSATAGTYRAPGYGQLSMNLLAPINPMAFGSVLIPPLPVTNPGQLEGYNYLGLGMIALLLLAVSRRPRLPMSLRDPRLLPLAGLGFACTAAAVSSTVTLGPVTLFAFDLPKPLNALAETFRISGRLFWPAYYLLVAAGLVLTFHAWHPPYRGAVLAIALAAQLIDLSPLRSKMREAADHHVSDPLQSPVWRELGRHYENLIVLPAFQCAPDLAPGGHPTYVIFGKLGASQRMRTNSYYAARYSAREMYVHCVEFPRAVLGGSLDSRSAYVVSDPVRKVLELSSMTSHRCEVVDGFNLCTPVSGGEAAPPRREVDAASYTLGDRIDFGATGNAGRYMIYGWARTPADGAWTNGPVAKLLLALPSPPTSAVLTVDSTPLVTRAHRRLDVEVVINGQQLDVWTFRYGIRERPRRVAVPAWVAVKQRFIDLEFRPLNPQAPTYVGEGHDVRFLGLYVRGLVLE
jgi:hypothetical protein